jgi:hypothetical protein
VRRQRRRYSEKDQHSSKGIRNGSKCKTKRFEEASTFAESTLPFQRNASVALAPFPLPHREQPLDRERITIRFTVVSLSLCAFSPRQQFTPEQDDYGS